MDELERKAWRDRLNSGTDDDQMRNLGTTKRAAKYYAACVRNENTPEYSYWAAVRKVKIPFGKCDAFHRYLLDNNLISKDALIVYAQYQDRVTRWKRNII